MVRAAETEPSNSPPYESPYGQMRSTSERENTYVGLRKDHQEKLLAPLSEGGVRVYRVEATRMDFWSQGFWGEKDMEDVTEFIFGAQVGRLSDPTTLTIRIEKDKEQVSSSNGGIVSLNLGVEETFWGLEAALPESKKDDVEPVRWVRGIVGQSTEDLKSSAQVGDQFHPGHIMHKLGIAARFQTVLAGLIEDEEPVYDSEAQLSRELEQRREASRLPENMVLFESRKTA